MIELSSMTYALDSARCLCETARRGAFAIRNLFARSAFTPVRRAFSIALRAALMSVLCASSFAEDAYRVQMRGLDEQVQQIKSDVLSIDGELNRLEEKLLYPSDTQLSLFVSIPKGDSIRLDAVQIQIDGQPAARYIYSFKELEALQKGGTQRIYTGNVPTGAHQLDVSVVAKLEGGKDYTPTGHFTINKGIGPKLVGITVAGPDSGKTAVDIGEW